jgi:proteasome lid subunit RPN8/RPN11
MSEAVVIAHHLLAAIAAHARAAFPRECCGYLCGERDNRAVDEVVACRNAADGCDAYAIDGRELFAFASSFASRRPALVAYHSHTNGQAYFSARDRAYALAGSDRPTYPVQHLVIGVQGGICTEAALFAWDPATAVFVEVARFSAQMLG